jgi:mono/diheme cytochrome c family protein
MLLRPTSSRTIAGERHTNGWVSIGISTALAFVLLSGGSTLVRAQDSNAQHQGKSNTNGISVARGKYIVEGVAMCGQCHTPHDSSGSSERSRWLQGAPVPWLPAKPDSDWPLTTPRIGGTPLPASDADMVKLLTTGIWTTGSPLRSPMPQFRMNREDAESVVAYLKSLNPQP